MATRKPKSRSRRASSRPTARRTARRSTMIRTRRASNGGNQWGREEIAFMRKYYRNNETSWVARKLGRTVYSVRYKASDLSIKKSSPSVWRGCTGTTSAKTRRPASRKSWMAKSTRSHSPAKGRRATTRRVAKRRH